MPDASDDDDSLDRINEYFYEQGWTDGLPVVPPVVDRVKAMLAADSRPPETVISRHPATGLDLSLHSAAVNAVMAGCLPEYFPVVVAIALAVVALAAAASTLPEIRKAFEAQRDIEYSISSIGPNDLEVDSSGDHVKISFAYDKEIELFSPVFLLIKYRGGNR